jgi:hypothetical protein
VYLGFSGLLELLCNLADLALAPRTQPAKSDFLHPVCDSSHQQLAAEMRRCLGFVESAPLLTKCAEVELVVAAMSILHCCHAGSGPVLLVRRYAFC